MTNTVKFVRHWSWGELFKRASGLILNPFYSDVTVCIFTDVNNVRSSVEGVVELSRNDIDAMAAVMYSGRGKLLRRFDCGHRCFAVVEGNDILSFFWVMTGRRYVPELRLNFKLTQQQAWMYNAVTVSNARGKGLYSRVIRHIEDTLSKEGFEEFFIDVNKRNSSSIKGIAKAGFRKIAEIRRHKVFWDTRYYHRLFENSVWQHLTVSSRNDEQLNFIVEK